MINKTIFLLKESFVLILRTKVPSIVSSLAISVGILVLTIAYCLYMTFEDLALNYKDRYTIEVYFNEDIQKNQAIEEFNQILLLDGIFERTNLAKLLIDTFSISLPRFIIWLLIFVLLIQSIIPIAISFALQ